MGTGITRSTGRLFTWVRMGSLLAVASCSALWAQRQAPTFPAGSPQAEGRQIFVSRCAGCHGTNANGGEFAPSIIDRVPLRTDDELTKLLHAGLITSGMPAFPDIVDDNRAHLISFLRTLKPMWGESAARTSVKLQNGQTLQGLVLNRSSTDLQLLADDHQLYLLRKDANTHIAP